MSNYTWATDERITKTIMDQMLYQNADGESADDLTKLAVKDQSGAGSYALELLSSETLGADRALTLTVNDAARTIDLSGDLTLAGDLITTGAYNLTFALGGTVTMTLPTTSQTLVGLTTTDTLTNKTLTAPDINGGTADALTSLGIRSTGASFDLILATTAAYGANRTLTVNIPTGTSVALTLVGDLITAGGAYNLTLTMTGSTNVTLPTTGTLITSSVTALSSLVTVGTIGTGTWQADTIDVPYGGTGLTTITDHGIMIGSGTGAVTPLGTGSAGQLVRSAGASADPAWTTLTMPATIGANEIFYASSSNTLGVISAAANSVLVSSGGSVPSMATDIPTAVTIGSKYIYRADGTDVPLADGGTNASLTADNGAIVYSTAGALALLAATATAGQILRSGSNAAPTWSTATYPATTTEKQLLYSSSANVVAGLTTGNDGVLVTSGAGVPSIATDIPTAVTIGTAYIYRVGGSDVAVADGGTNIGSYTTGDLIYASGATALSKRAAVASGQVLTSAGTSTAPVWSASPVIGTRIETKILNLTDDTELTMDGNGEITVTQSYHSVDTNGDGGTDDLEAITGGSEGDILIIFPEDAGHTIVAQHAGTPTAGDALNLAGGANFSMDENDDFLMLLHDGTVWQELSRSENHA